MNDEGLNSVGALILAAGFSKRMGIPKAFLMFDKRTMFIEKIINEYIEFGCKRIIITIDEKNKDWLKIKNQYKLKSNVYFAVNHHPEFERFYSVKIGLLEMYDVNYCFLQNVDNPFVSKTILNSLYSRRKETAFVVPTYKSKGGHPIMLGDEIMNYILSIENNHSNLKEVLKDCQRIECSVNDENILININDLKDYKKYFNK